MMIEAEALTRRYGAFTAVDAVSFAIETGEVVGLLGHNGAGKTTIMKMLTGYLEPSAGVVRINGLDIAARRQEAQARIGYLPENCPVYPDMTVVGFLDYVAALRGVADADRAGAVARAIAATALGEKAGDAIATLSRGYRQRVGVAQAILHAPSLVILDEPTNGLDPSQIQQMRALIRDLATTATVIVSTHILQEVHAVCDRVLIMDRGRLALDARLEDLRRNAWLHVVTRGAQADLAAAADGVAGLGAPAPAGEDAGANTFRIPLTDPEADAPGALAAALAEAMHARGLPVMALHPQHRDLEAVFADITAGRRPGVAATAPGAAKAAPQVQEAAHV